MPIALIESALMIAGLLATAALLWRMFHEQLRGYNSLALYLVWNFVGAIPLFFIERRTKLYTAVYVGLTAVQWVINVLVTLELVSLITSRYPGIRSVTRIAVNVALVVAAIVAFLSAMIDFGPNTGTVEKLNTFFLVDRTVQVSNLGFLFVVLAFLFWFPIGISRNVLYYAVGFVLVFATRISALVLGNLFGLAAYRLVEHTRQLCFPCSYLLLGRAHETRERADSDCRGARLEPHRRESVDRPTGLHQRHFDAQYYEGAAKVRETLIAFHAFIRYSGSKM